MTNWQIAILIGGILGLIGGRWVAVRSAQKEALRGGRVSSVLHYLACAAQTSAAPTALVAAIVSRDLHLVPRILTSVGLALGFIVLALILLVTHAAYETTVAKS